MAQFAILASNGFYYEYVITIEAENAYEARKWFKREFAGDHRTENFKVSKR